MHEDQSIELIPVQIEVEYDCLGKMRQKAFMARLLGHEVLWHWGNVVCQTYLDDRYNHIRYTNPKGDQYAFPLTVKMLPVLKL